ncbi:MAG: GntR family transcriptional regulator [Rhodospirillales bacterium]|nr:GntR family transcriptional regulator [Rhodospirillales bacterium]
MSGALFHREALAGADSETAGPLYLQLARHVRKLIADGALQVEQALPAERELAERFGVSRVTVRKALQELVDEGLLQQRARAGTYVSRGVHVVQALSALTGFTEDMRSRGLEPSSHWLRRGTATATPDEAMALGLQPGEMVSRLHRVRLVDGTPIAIEHATIAARFLPDPDSVRGSLYERLRVLGHGPHRALQRLSAIVLDAEQSKILQVPPGTPALSIERRSFLKDGRPLELMRSQYRGDAYDVIVELNLNEAKG